MNAPRVHQLHAVQQGSAQPGPQGQQVLVGRYGEYTYKVDLGKGGEHAPGSGAAHKPPGPQRRLGPAPRRPASRRRTVDSPQDQADDESMDDPTDDSAEPFDPFKHLALQNESRRQGGQDRGQQGDSSGRHPKGRVPPPKPRPEDPARGWMQANLPGAALLLGKGPVSGLELLGAAAALVLGAVQRAAATRGRVCMTQTLLAAACHALRRTGVDFPTMNLLVVRNLLMDQQRQLGAAGMAGARPEWLGDRLALVPLHVLNIGRPRTPAMRANAVSRQEFMLQARRPTQGEP